MDFFEFWPKGVFLDALSYKKIKKIRTRLKISFFTKKTLKVPGFRDFRDNN